jgi:hypothetical protein
MGEPFAWWISWCSTLPPTSATTLRRTSSENWIMGRCPQCRLTRSRAGSLGEVLVNSRFIKGWLCWRGIRRPASETMARIKSNRLFL